MIEWDLCRRFRDPGRAVGLRVGARADADYVGYVGGGEFGSAAEGGATIARGKGAQSELHLSEIPSLLPYEVNKKKPFLNRRLALEEFAK